MWTQKEKAIYRDRLDASRESLHRMYANEKTSDKAKAVFNRPLFGGVKKGANNERKTEGKEV